MMKEENSEDIINTSEIKLEDDGVEHTETTELLHHGAPFVHKSNFPSSSSREQRLNLISMGFSPFLVDKAIDKHGENNMDLLIDCLCSQSVVQSLKPELDPVDGRHFDEEDNGSSFELSFSDTEEIKEKKPLVFDLDKKQFLLRMDFSAEDAELAINQLGTNASIPELIDYIIASQIAGGDHGNTVITTETLFKTREKSLLLLEMGFTEEEISTAIDNFGSDPSVEELANSIFAKRFSNGRVKIEHDAWPDKDGIGFPDKYKPRCSRTEDRNECMVLETDLYETKPLIVNDVSRGSKETRERKRPKWVPVRDTSVSSSFSNLGKRFSEIEHPSTSLGMAENEEKLLKQDFSKKNSIQCASVPPYFFFGNVADSSQETWNKLSRFLDGTEPEHVNSQFFSALVRKETYFHNLPTENRNYVTPRPAMTIEEALPDTKRWWPSWDTRKQLGCILSDSSDAACICERLERMLVCSNGMLTKEEQMDTLHHCRTLNLLWVGKHKLRPIETYHAEYILGYPMEHTRIDCLGDADRMRALRYSFQIDTLGYHLSPLKCMFPDGLRVLSVYSGIGGAEITLARLGIHIKFAVSVESSEINRKILKRWWQNTGQSGQLRQLDSIEKLRGSRIETLINEFGGFDLVISGNPHNYKYGVPQVESSEGVDFTLFLESVRILRRIKGLMARR